MLLQHLQYLQCKNDQLVCKDEKATIAPAAVYQGAQGKAWGIKPETQQAIAASQMECQQLLQGGAHHGTVSLLLPFATGW